MTDFDFLIEALEQTGIEYRIKWRLTHFLVRADTYNGFLTFYFNYDKGKEIARTQQL